MDSDTWCRRFRIRTIARGLHVACATAVPPRPEQIEQAFQPLEGVPPPDGVESGARQQQGKLYGFIDVENPKPLALTRAQIEHYNFRGFTPPIQVYSTKEAAANRDYVDRLMAHLEAEGRDSYSVQSFHLKSRTMWDIASNPAILDRVQDILGPSFVMWGSHMFCKMPNDGRAMRPVPMHQDATYWPFATTRTCTVWLALDDADEDNSAMLFVPGSHRRVIPWRHFDAPGAVLNNETPDPESHGLPGEGLYVNAMPAGYISIHADLLIHGSAPNLSTRRRCGLTLRYCASDARPLGGDDNAGRGTFFGGYVLKCRGDAEWWGEPGRHVAPPPAGHEDWTPLSGKQVAAAQLAAV